MTQLDRPRICCIPVVVSRHATGAAGRAPERLRPLVPRMQNRPPGDAMAAGYPQGVRVADQREPRGAALATARGSASATARRPGAQRGSEGPSNALAPRHDAGGSVVPSLRGASSSPTPIALTRTERVPPSSSATDTAIVVCRRRRPTRIGRSRDRQHTLAPRRRPIRSPTASRRPVLAPKRRPPGPRCGRTCSSGRSIGWRR